MISLISCIDKIIFSLCICPRSFPCRKYFLCPHFFIVAKNASWNVRFTLCTMPVNTDQPSSSVVLGKKTTCSKNRSERKMNAGVVTGFQGRVKKGKRTSIFSAGVFSSLSILFSLLGASIISCSNRFK